MPEIRPLSPKGSVSPPIPSARGKRGSEAAGINETTPDRKIARGYKQEETRANQEHLKIFKRRKTVKKNLHFTSTDETRKKLRWAAENGCLEDVQELIDNGENLSGTDEDGNTALHLAAKKGHSNVVKYLLKNDGADSTSTRKNKNKRLPLHLAAEKGDLNGVRHFIMSGSKGNLEATDELGMTPLDLAAEKGHLAVVKELVSGDAEVVDEDAIRARPKKGEKEVGEKEKLRVNTVEREATAVHYAVKAGHTDVVKFLLENGNGAEALEMTDGMDKTPLHLALMYDNEVDPDKAKTIREESVKALCQRKTNPNLEATDKDGNNVLIWAVKHHQLDTVKAIVKIRDKNGGRVDLNRRATDRELKRTALMMAIDTNQADIVKELLNGGAYPDMYDNGELRAIMLAVQHRNKEVVQMLIEKGATLKFKKDGRTALHMALHNDDIDIARLLIQGSSKLDLMATDHIERTYLHCAAQRNNAKAVTALAERARYLKMRTEDLIEAEDTGEKSPLHIAAQMGNLEAVRALINVGVVLDSEDLDEKMPIDLARENGHDEVEIELDRAMGAA